jgi:hypothetical protein
MKNFPYGRTFILGFGFFGISVIWPLFNSLIPPMLQDLGLAAVAVGFILHGTTSSICSCSPS